MRSILKSGYRSSVPIKLVVLLVGLIGVLAFIGSLHYAGKNKITYTELKLNSLLLPPACSHKGGFYTTAFSVSLTTTAPFSKIYYTLDGSMPSLKSEVYTGPIRIEEAVSKSNSLSDIPTSPRWQPPLGNVYRGIVLRAITVTADDKKSNEFIRTFFIDKKGKKKYSLPVMALTVNPEDFFDYKKGIYVLGKNYDDKKDYIKKDIQLDLPWWEYPSNYLKRGDNSSRPVYVEFYERTGSMGFEQQAIARINGNKTRGFSQKSLRITFVEKNNSTPLNYPLFPNESAKLYHSFILRNGGNDWNKTLFRDELMQSIMSETAIDRQGYQPAVVFINGEYWGIHNIRERYDENYFATKYQLSVDSLVILESGKELLYGKKQDLKDFKQLLTYVQSNDMSLPSTYQYLEKQVDLENVIDFIIANVYFVNNDWQEKIWRYRTSPLGADSAGKGDGRWRWVLYDMDWGLGYTGTSAVDINMLEVAKTGGCVGIIFQRLLKNKIFVDKFAARFHHHLDVTFQTDKVIGKIDQFHKLLQPEMEEHINRWRVMGSFSNWEANVGELRNFARKRPGIQREQLDKFLKTNSTDSNF